MEEGRGFGVPKLSYQDTKKSIQGRQNFDTQALTTGEDIVSNTNQEVTIQTEPDIGVSQQVQGRNPQFLASEGNFRPKLRSDQSPKDDEHRTQNRFNMLLNRATYHLRRTR
jgi:hypothetical protein